MRKIQLLVAALGVGIGMSAMAMEPKEENIKLESAPAAVQAAIKKAVGAGTLGDVTKEVEDGKTVFEADFTIDKVDHAVKVNEKGEVLEEEVDVEIASLPAAVTASIKAKYADGKVEDAELVKAAGKSFYEVSVEAGGADHKIQIDAAGKVLSDKVEEEDDDKGEKDGHEKK